MYLIFFLFLRDTTIVISDKNNLILACLQDLQTYRYTSELIMDETAVANEK